MYEPSTQVSLLFSNSSPGTICARCLDVLRTDAVAVRRTRGTGAASVATSFHPECALDVDTRHFCALLRGDGRIFDGRDSLERLAFLREQAIEQRALSQWRERLEPGGGVSAVAPSRAVEDDPALLHPARDRRGRPRVRVLILGTAVNDANESAARFWLKLREGGSWASAKREYVFVSRVGWRIAPDEDPAQPIIGLVYAPLAKKRAKLERHVFLWLLAAMGMSPPLLWLHGIKASSTRDENVLYIREHVERSGFQADLCPTLCAPTVDDAALDALVLALDDHCDGAERRITQHQATAVAHAILRMEPAELDAVDDRRFEAMLAYAAWGRTSASDAVVTALAEALIDRGAWSRAERVLVSGMVQRSALFERWFEREQTMTDRARSKPTTKMSDAYAAARALEGLDAR